MLIYFRDEAGDHLVELGEEAGRLADPAEDEPIERLAGMAERVEVDLAWAEGREIEVMQQTCARCAAHEACRRWTASGGPGDHHGFCRNAVLLDMIWVRGAVGGGLLAAQHAAGRVA